MKKTFRTADSMVHDWKRAVAFLLLTVLAAGMAFRVPVQAVAAEKTCKELCQTVLEVTGNGDKIEYQSSNAGDFAGFTVSDRSRVASVMYLYDAKQVYSICVIKASGKAGAKQLLKSVKTYRASNRNSNYLSDYSEDEQKVFQSAVSGRKGKYVWYIAMSATKADSKKAQSALKKAISS